MRLRAQLLARVIAAGSLLAASSCASNSRPPDSGCAWQCRVPYELDVTFRPGTARLTAAAAAAMAQCRADPNVIQIATPRWNPVLGQWTAVILTKTMGRRAEPAPGTPATLLMCLRRSPLAAAWAALGGKWKLIIITSSPRHPPTSRACAVRCPRSPRRVLAEQLRELVGDGIADRPPPGPLPIRPSTRSATTADRSCESSRPPGIGRRAYGAITQLVMGPAGPGARIFLYRSPEVLLYTPIAVPRPAYCRGGWHAHGHRPRRSRSACRAGRGAVANPAAVAHVRPLRARPVNRMTRKSLRVSSQRVRLSRFGSA